MRKNLVSETIEKEAERERLIDQLLTPTSIDKYSAKLGNDTIKNNIFHITKELPVSEIDWAFKSFESCCKNTQILGSIAEGAAMVRNLKPNPHRNILKQKEILCVL